MGEPMNVNGRRHSAARGLLYFCLLTCAALHLALGPSGVQAAIPAGSVRIHYYRPDGTYTGWALYTWNASTENASWCSSEVPITGIDTWGVYYDVTVNPSQGSPAGQLGFIINNCDNGQVKDPGANQYLQVTQYTQGW